MRVIIIVVFIKIFLQAAPPPPTPPTHTHTPPTQLNNVVLYSLLPPGFDTSFVIWILSSARCRFERLIAQKVILPCLRKIMTLLKLELFDLDMNTARPVTLFYNKKKKNNNCTLIITSCSAVKTPLRIHLIIVSKLCQSPRNICQ